MSTRLTTINPVSRPRGSDKTSPSEFSPTKNTKPPTRKMGKPECNSGRAQRAGGRNCHIPSRIGIPIPIRHGRTSQSVAHGNLYSNCNVSYRIRRACATVGLSDGAQLTSPHQQNRVAPDAIRGCRRQQETDRANALFRTTNPTRSSQGPSHVSTRLASINPVSRPRGADKTSPSEFSHHKKHESNHKDLHSVSSRVMVPVM